MIKLNPQWIETCKDIGFKEPDIGLFQDLCQSYSEPHRRYHTLQHLSECLALADQDRALAQFPSEVSYALWFHDAMYEVNRDDNELQSANWARATLSAHGIAAEVSSRVHALIMATSHSAQPTTRDARLVVDIDLAILAAGTERFAEYERQVREEYRHVPEAIFQKKRRAVLESFARRPRIYLTHAYARRYEAIARKNIGSDTNGSQHPTLPHLKEE